MTSGGLPNYAATMLVAVMIYAGLFIGQRILCSKLRGPYPMDYVPAASVKRACVHQTEQIPEC